MNGWIHKSVNYEVTVHDGAYLIFTLSELINAKRVIIISDDTNRLGNYFEFTNVGKNRESISQSYGKGTYYEYCTIQVHFSTGSIYGMYQCGGWDFTKHITDVYYIPG